MGRNKFSQSEIKTIAMLLHKKNLATRFQQKEIRHQLRTEFEFNISDFNVQGKAFGDVELYEAIDRGAIKILDDATITDMKAKRARDKARDAELQAQQTPPAEGADWQKAMEEWEQWEKSAQQ